MAVVGVSSTTLTVVRGIHGTAAATHPSGASVYLVSDQRGYVIPANAPPIVDMGAAQSTGVNIRPTITAINPNAGIASGGTTVTITGTFFTTAIAVKFGAVNAGFAVNSPTQITATAPAGAGIVDVTVTTQLGGTSATSSADQFTYVAPPVVTGLTPNTGPATGGTSVIITGSGFSGATSVHFDGTLATSFTVNSATQITAIASAGTGTVDVTVTIPFGGTSATSNADQFTYVAAPTVTGLSPNAGPATGGTSVLITGTGLTGATAVYFDGSAATSFTVNSDSQITATSPAGAGTVDVIVTTVGGTSTASSADQFTYLTPTTTSLVDNGPNPSLVSQAVSFTATVGDNTNGGQTLTPTINGETVYIEDASNANAVVASPTLTNGSVTFTISDLSIGTHDLFAVYNGDATRLGSNSSATPVTQVVNNGPAPVVASVVINGGTPQYVDSNGESWSLAGQNSVVEQILVTFNEPVTLDAGAFSIVNNAAGVTVVSGDGPNTLPVTANDLIPVSGGSESTQWIVTFSGPGTIPLVYGGVGAVIRDGLYILHTDGSKVHAYSQTASDNDTGFWAMYGAVHDNTVSSTIGDGQSNVFIDCCDFNDFRYWLNHPAIDSTDPAYASIYFAYDYDLDGFCDADTFNRFRQKLNTMQEWVF
jgi:hypothetical protein